MNLESAIASLESSGRALAGVPHGLSAAVMRFKPAPEKWSVLEVFGHLIDEERDDFRMRVRLTLEDPATEWPPIDPDGWARDRKYNELEPEDALASFKREREISLAWLRGLRHPDWERGHPHPQAGTLRAGDLLASWVAHDLLHLRQITNVRLIWTEQASAPFSIRYAG